MSLRGWSKDRSSRKVTPPGPSYMSSDQFATYLTDLRNNRVTRPVPTGARPRPASNISRRDTLDFNIPKPTLDEAVGVPPRSESAQAHRRTPSALSNHTTTSRRGRALFKKPFTTSHASSVSPKTDAQARILKPSEVVPSATYIERGQRWMEKEEVYALRDAMQDLDDSQEQRDEARLHAAAQKEASELVHAHQNPSAARRPDGPYKYKEHMRKNSYATVRTASVKGRHSHIGRPSMGRSSSRSVSGSSNSSDEQGPSTRVVSGTGVHRVSGDTTQPSDNVPDSDPEAKALQNIRPKSYRGLSDHSRTPSGKHARRNISGEIGVVFHPEQIYEEPEVVASTVLAQQQEDSAKVPAPLRLKARNPLNRVQFAQEPVYSEELAGTPKKMADMFEIHRNPPSQSRNPVYTANTPPNPADLVRAETPTKDGLEIRGEDIRSATSKSLKDRSPRLPTPEVVSNRPGRPIVSFDKDWKPKGEDRDPTPDVVNDDSTAVVAEPEKTTTRAESVSSTSAIPTVSQARSSTPSDEPSNADRVAAQMPRVSIDGSISAVKAVPKGPRRPLFGQGRFGTKEESQSLPTVPTTKTIELEVSSKTQVLAAPSFQVNDIPLMAISSDVKHAVPPLPIIILPDEPPMPSMNRPEEPPIQVSTPSISVSPPQVLVSATAPARRSPFSRPLPTINLPSAPTITIDTAEVQTQPKSVSARPLPDPKARSTRPRPLPIPRATAPVPSNTGHWTVQPTVGRATATCHQCSLAIQGQVVSVRGFPERFHPTCLTCHICDTALEALEISPEPEANRSARLERIQRREQGEEVEEVDGQTELDDGDSRLRFFCHLDWHELYAPRCRHCKTPILGEHAVALGEHWHYGHFFCAECGDPFERGMTHIEIEGYAWCVGCSSKRTQRRAPKCRGCRQGVVGDYVQALGGEWHAHCFKCAECGGEFDDGKIFVLEGREGANCVRCMERVWKA